METGSRRIWRGRHNRGSNSATFASRSAVERSRFEGGTIFPVNSMGSVSKPFHISSHHGTLSRGKWDDFGDMPLRYKIYTVPLSSQTDRSMGRPSRDSVDLLREFEVVVGNAVAVVGRSFDLRIAPAELDVRMVIGGFGDLTNVIDEGKRFGKILELKLPFDLVVVKLPAVERCERRIYFFFGQFSSFHFYSFVISMKILCALCIKKSFNTKALEASQSSQRNASFRRLRYNCGFAESNEMRTVYSSLLIFSAIFAAACGAASEPKSPVETMKTYTKAVKAKDTTTMKLLLSADTIKMLEQEAKSQNVVLDEIVKRETLFPESQKVFEFRNEKIEGEKATIEVKNSFGQWETWPFVFEDSQWKIDKKGYADRLMLDIQQQNDAAIDDVIKQNQISPDPLATPATTLPSPVPTPTAGSTTTPTPTPSGALN